MLFNVYLLSALFERTKNNSDKSHKTVYKDKAFTFTHVCNVGTLSDTHTHTYVVHEYESKMGLNEFIS